MIGPYQYTLAPNWNCRGAFRIEVMLASNACRVMKVAWRARSLRDNLEAFALVNQRHKPTIALCMGDEGLASRVLSKKFNALLTFVALNPESATAPGQPTVEAIGRSEGEQPRRLELATQLAQAV